MKFIDLAGQRFSRLIALGEVGKRDKQGARWLCRCDCENTIIVRSGDLRSGNTKSCGCLRFDHAGSSPRHGHARKGRLSPEYKTWARLNSRCRDLRNKYYGGRGIRVEFESFEEFLAHIGPKPTPRHSIDRIDVYGNYCIGNVRWADAKMQRANQRFQP